MLANPSTLDEHNDISAGPVQADTKFFDDQFREYRKQEVFRQWHKAKEETNLFQFWKNKMET